MDKVWQIALALISGGLLTFFGTVITQKYKREHNKDQTSLSQFDQLTAKLDGFNTTLQKQIASERTYFSERLRICEEKCARCEADHANAKQELLEMNGEIAKLRQRIEINND